MRISRFKVMGLSAAFMTAFAASASAMSVTEWEEYKADCRDAGGTPGVHEDGSPGCHMGVIVVEGGLILAAADESLEVMATRKDRLSIKKDYRSIKHPLKPNDTIVAKKADQAGNGDRKNTYMKSR